MDKLSPKTKKILLGIFVSIIVISICVSVYFGVKNVKNDIIDPGNDVEHFKHYPAYYFFTIDSTDGKSGRTNDGDCYFQDEKKEDGISTKAQAMPFLLTYEASDIMEKDWDTFCLKHTRLVSTDFVASDVLVLEDGGTYYLDRSLSAKGLVVRHGTKLYIKSHFDSKSTLNMNVEFVLVESGGLLQAGHKTKRYKGKLQFLMKSTPLGYAHQGVVCSQYSYKFYNPGVLLENSTDGNPKFTNFNGKTCHISNHFAPRCFALGFCGNVHLCGDVSSDVPYTGTWNNSMSIGLKTLENAYPNTWCHLESSCGKKGDTTITLDPSVIGHMETWTQGSEIVLTYFSRTYATGSVKPRTLGTPPIWLNYKEGTQNYVDNSNAIKDLQDPDEAGVEVCTIKNIKKNVITLEQPLKLNRTPLVDTYPKNGMNFGGNSGRYSMRDTDKNIRVIDTRVHVGLLTRNIVIKGEILHGPGTGGMNNMKTSQELKEKYPEEAQYKGNIGTCSCGMKCVPDYNVNRSAEWNRKILAEECFKRRDEGLAIPWDGKKDTRDPEYMKFFTSYRHCSCPKQVPGTSFYTIDKPQLPEEMYGEPRGMWQMGSAGWRGSNSIGSANCMFRMGCVVNIDGVEMRSMGAPGNTGNLGEYVFHFHCMGYAQSFNAYLPDYKGIDDVTSKRYSSISNCSMVQCPSRLIVLHGTSEVVCKNNVSLLSYNSAYFLESGGERFNRFEHQLSIGVMLCRPSKYDNSSPLFPIGSFDSFQSSVYWLKNSCNEVVRCVTCCSPRPMIGVWIIPQHISGMKNMSDICPGDKDLELPANITQEIMDGPQFGPNQFSWNPKTAWAPPSYYKKGLVNINNCATYSHTNATNPVFPMLDNVFYNIAGGFTSYVAFSPNVPCARGACDEAGATKCAGARHTDENIRNNAEETVAIDKKSTGLFLPISAENALLDIVSTTEYVHPEFNGQVKKCFFEPFDISMQKKWNGVQGNTAPCTNTAPCPGNTHGLDSGCRNIPFIVGAQLSWNLCDISSNTLGAGWSKSPINIIIKCCALQLCGSGEAGIDGIGGSRITSSSFRLSYGDNRQYWIGTRTVYHDFVTDGAIEPSDTPMLFSGENSFFSESARFCNGEYPNNKCSIYDWYVYNKFPKALLTRILDTCSYKSRFKIYDINNNDVLDMSNNSSTKWDNASKLTTPYFCELCENDKASQLSTFKDATKSGILDFHPTWNIIANAYTNDLFTTKTNIDLGNNLCLGMSKMKGFV